jgi:hypothetical protein
MRLFFVYLVTILCAAGCTSTDSPFRTVIDVPFEKQEDWYCGATAASELLHHYGTFVTQHEIASCIFSRRQGGIINTDLSSFLKDRGLVTETLRIRTYSSEKQKQAHIELLMDDLKHYIDHGHPVIVLLGPRSGGFGGFKIRLFIAPFFFYMSDYEEVVNLNHYVLVTGYDDIAGAVFCHDGVQANARYSYTEFLRRWGRAG